MYLVLISDELVDQVLSELNITMANQIPSEIHVNQLYTLTFT